MAKYLESPSFICHCFGHLEGGKKTSSGIGGLTNIIMVKWTSLGNSTAQRLQVPVVLAGDLNCSSFGRLRGVANTLSLLHLDSLMKKHVATSD